MSYDREQCINELIADDCRLIQDGFEDGDAWYLESILNVGFKGYADYTDEEIIQEMNDRDMSYLYGENDE